MTDLAQITKEAELRISKARSYLLLKEPFFGLIALRLQLIPIRTPEIPVMGVSRTALYFNPDVVVMLPKHSIIFIVAHEVMHVVLGHYWRMKDENRYPDQDRVNSAQDYAINPILMDEGFARPDAPYAGLVDKQFHNMSAEEIYPLLPDEQSDGDKIGANMGITVGDKLTEEEARIEERLVKQAITEAKDAAKMQGKLPGSLESILDDITEVQVDWRKELTTYFFERVRDGYTWSRPNRRFIHSGIYLPSHMEIPTGNIVVCIDTSGSLNAAQLSDFMAELNGILEYVKPKKITVVQCDTQIRSTHEYTSHDLPIKVSAVGRGGTNFNPVFNAIEDGDIDPPAVLVYFTDMLAPFPEEEPMYPVVWLSHGNKYNAPWGATIHIGD